MFHIGQRVLCVWMPRKGNKGYGWETHPQIGSVYTVRDLEDLGDGPGVRLVEITNKKANYAEGWSEVNFCPSRFRALSEIEMLAPAECAESV